MTDAGGPLATRTWGEVGSPVVVVPVGSFEQHGPHLPLGTDTLIATALADALVAAQPSCVLGPSIGVTASGEHQGFPGTLSIGRDAMAAVLIELTRSADWAIGVVFVNGHGGNAAALAEAASVFARERRRALIWSPRVAGGDLHAGHTETSLMLHLAPALVRLERAAIGPQPPLADLVAHGVRALSPTGVLGDPSGATAEAGRQLFDELAHQLVGAVAAAISEWG